MTAPHFVDLPHTDPHPTNPHRGLSDHVDQRAYVRTLVSAFAVIVFVAMCRTIYVAVGFGISWPQFAHGILLVPLVVPAFYFTFTRFNSAFSSLFGAVGLAVLATTLAFETSWLVMHTGRHVPFVDAMLAKADGFFGFDWPAVLKYFDRHAHLDPLWQAAYKSIAWQPGFIIVALVMTRQFLRPFQLIIAMTVALSITCIAAIFCPAVGPYEFFKLAAADHANISLITDAKMTSGLQWLRTDELKGLLPHFEVGLISFPSFHAASAALFMWALWRTPIARWIGLAVNAGMLISTPVHGSHYMVDVLAGIAVAVVSVPVSLWLLGHFGNAGARATRKLRPTEA